MKLSDILLLSLFCVTGSMIFAIKKMQAGNATDTVAVPVPALKPKSDSLSVPAPLPKVKPEASLAKPRLKISNPEKAGSYGRLSLDEFLAKDSPSIGIGQAAPKSTARQNSPVNSVIKQPHKNTSNQATLQTQPPIKLSKLKIDTADPVNLPYLPQIDQSRFLDRVVDIAETSPLQPDSRGCGTLNYNLKSAPKHAKVRSVGMERQLTGRTSIGVEYVYKDGCYKNAIVPFKSLDIPGDDGVNLRVNMKF